MKPDYPSQRRRPRLPARLVVALCLLAPLLLWGGLRAQAAPPAQPAADGEALFAQRCAACHTVGGGALVGPDLLGVVASRAPAWLERWIVEPDKMLAEGDPLALELLAAYNGVPMPNMGLSAAEARAVIAYLAAASGAPAAPAPPAPAGDPAIGRQLFTGQILLANGGTACMACHTVGQAGALGGGTLGPDLSHAAARYGEAGLAAALAGLPFPTMQGVFAERPLTPEEAAHLHAYLLEADQSRLPPEERGLTFAWLGLGGALVLLGLGHLLWINRHRGVRRPLVRRMRLR